MIPAKRLTNNAPDGNPILVEVRCRGCERVYSVINASGWVGEADPLYLDCDRCHARTQNDRTYMEGIPR